MAASQPAVLQSSRRPTRTAWGPCLPLYSRTASTRSTGPVPPRRPRPLPLPPLGPASGRQVVAVPGVGTSSPAGDSVEYRPDRSTIGCRGARHLTEEGFVRYLCLIYL